MSTLYPATPTVKIQKSERATLGRWAKIMNGGAS
jgi:hypothetical protein